MWALLLPSPHCKMARYLIGQNVVDVFGSTMVTGLQSAKSSSTMAETWRWTTGVIGGAVASLEFPLWLQHG